MKHKRNTLAFAFILLIALIAFILLPFIASAQTTSQADTVRIDKEAFIALEGSEQYHYTLAGTFERLWIEKRKECDLLNEQLRAALENESLNAESIRLLRGQIAQLQKEIAELEERIKDAERKNKRARLWGNVKAGFAFAFGVFVGVKVVR